MTKESPDSIVTQVRRDVREQESITFNVAASGSGGETNPGPASIPTNRRPGPDVSTPEASPAAPKPGPGPRELRSWQLASKWWRDDVRFSFGEDGMPAYKPSPGGNSPGEAEWAEALELMPEFGAALRSKGVRPPAAVPAVATAPPIPAAIQSDVLGKLKALPGNPARAAVVSAARALTEALGPHRDHDLTVATFMGLCGDARREGLALGVLLEAFDAACGKKRNRGGTFIDEVKRQKKDQHPRRGLDSATGGVPG